MKKFIITLLFFFSAYPNGYAEKQVKSPEIEINKAISKLTSLSKKLSGSRLFYLDTTVGAKESNAKQSLENGIKFFFHKEYHSAIREFNYYLDTTQSPVKPLYLSATHKLAVSYDQIGKKSKATSEYLNYIASFLTSEEKNYDDLLDVMRRLLSLASSPEIRQRGKIGKLLASLTSLELPVEVQSGVLFMAARTAIESGGDSEAVHWLDRSIGSTKDKIRRIQALYFKSLMEINRKNWDLAEQYMMEAVSVDPNMTDETRDLTRIALARIQSQKGKKKTALRIYSSLSEESPVKKDAMYESIYLLINMENFKQARNLANLFVSRFPETSEAIQLKSLMAFFELKAGNIAIAKSSVDSKSSNLQSLRSWLSGNLKSKSSLSRNNIQLIYDRANVNVEHPYLVSRSIQIFNKLSEMKKKLAKLKGDYTNTLLTLGRTNLEQFNPEWVNRAKQLKILSEEVIGAGHRLIAAERFLYKSSIDRSEFMMLSASENRRVHLSSQKSKLRRNKKRWANLGNLFQLTHDIANQYMVLDKFNSQLSSLRYLAKTSQSKSKLAKIEKLQNHTRELFQSISKALELVRQHRLNELFVQSPHLEDQRFLTLYSGALFDEQQLLEKTRLEASGLGSQLLAEDGLRAWRLWKKVMAQIFRQYKILGDDIKDGINSTLINFDSLDDRYNQHLNDLEMYIYSLETQLGKSSSLILSQYNHNISRKLSRQRKWAADIEWLEYDRLENQRKNTQKKYDLEKQILRDNLNDLNQGVVWEWQN